MNQIQRNSYFKLFSNCILVPGATKAAIYDLQREQLFHIPLSFYEILTSSEIIKVSNLYDEYPQDHETLREYFDLLTQNDLIFFMESKQGFENFPEIDFSFNYPSLLSNVIIALKPTESILKYVENIIANVVDTKCKYLQLRFRIDFNSSIFQKVLTLFFENTFFKGLNLIIHQSIFDHSDSKEILKHPLIGQIIVFGTENNSSKNSDPNDLVYYEKTDFPKFTGLNEFRFNHFQPNIISYSEAKSHNLYYNKKAYIAPNGEVFQSPFANNSMGTIFKNSLKEIVEELDFQEIWDISKDKIAVCKDCEFRYVCNDGRIPLKKEKKYYFEEACTYDPYNE
ncbi:grasp-with-spasm system SPASM domain peptide maturase [uncultured Aquimarina sp.]|uniref:grasp-with-spasm system SPASM domain peptide maturase n=1 Tax=uncultured Aquimarina sp. TaxID=575652 RepID=UPI002606C289|nr:grasp-with-spasm system SPASM domain peptide maturase [uncultured Aquimarina sp.]